MEKEIDKKLESLRKYIPFVDYVTHVDREKYKKFLDIKSWIINKKRCAISDLMKIEQSFIAQYKNLFLEDLKVPEDIRKIFAGRVDFQYVNLCSDDEKGETNSPQQITKSESDGDLETIDLLFPTSSNGEMEKDSEAPRIDLKEMLTVIETLDSNNSGKEKLFARRSDISSEKIEKHAAKQNVMRNKKKSLPLLSVTETISLDSSTSDDDSAPAISSEKRSEPKPPKYENVNAAADRRLLSPQGSTLLNTRKEHQEDSVVSANIKYGNNKTSENMSDAINRLADKNEVNNNRSTSNDRLSQLTGGFESLSMEELTLLFNSLNQGHQLEKFLSHLQKNCQSHEKFENIHGEKAHRTNERLFTDMPTPEAAGGNTGFSTAHLQEHRFFNTHRELTALPPPTKQLNPTAFHQFPIQYIAGGTYPGHVPNDNQSTATTNVHHRPTYGLNLSQRADIGISIPGPGYPMQRKLNMNDPRILKLLQRIQNFPFASNTLRDKTTSLRRNIPPFQFPTDQTENAATNWSTNFPSSTHQLVAHNINQQRTLVNNFMLKRSNPNVSKTYLEHKRRKAEEERKKKDRLNEEMQQRGAKKQDKEAVPAAQQIENKELKNQEDQILSIPHTHLISREGDVQTLWDEYKRNFESTSKVTDQVICDSQSSSGTSSEVSSSLTNKISHFSELAKVNNETTQSPQPVTTIPANEVKQLPSHVTVPKANNETRQSSNCATIVEIRNKTKQPSHSRTIASANNDKINKVHKTLECTINGYNQFENYIPKSLGGKRRSSMHARDIISKQLNDGDSLIVFDINANSKSKRQRQSEVKRARSLRIEDSSDSDADSLPPEKTSLKYIRKRQPVVKLQHLKEGQCFKNQHPFQDLSKLNQIGIASDEQKKLNVQLIETRSTPVEIDQNEKITANINKCYRRNNNCQMTELNTRFCVLCAAKPANLTNHYIRKHKTESYVSRLTWAQLDDLVVQTNFAELQGSGNQRSARFKVTCPFCEDILIQPFMTLYDHYSKHTGEYAYMCTHCSFTKPFRADILSHQRNSKNCRRATLKIMYRYPPNTMAIYLHYCSICNYAQLNKANVLKHLREQHSPREAIESNVNNCILAAIQIAPRTQADESCSNLTNTKLRSNEDNIHDGLQENLNSLDQTADKVKEVNAMCNEPCAEKTEMVDDIRKLKFFQNQVTQDPVSITENHCPIDAKGSIVGMSVALAGQQPRHPIKHLKCEEMDVFEMDMTPLTQFSESARHPESALTLNESPLIYRSFPANVTYLGLYKCIAEDCYFSTNHADEMLSHLEDHANSECTPVEYIQCAYCVLRLGECNTAQELIKHIQLQHEYNIYQCSLCCYRSCDASNVSIHQHLMHPYKPKDCCIYMCAKKAITIEQKKSYLTTMKGKNVQKIVCPYCSAEFFATYHLQKHMELVHKITGFNLDLLKSYSCIYCPTSDRDHKSIRIHLAIQHPGEFPFICDHKITEDVKMDCVQSLKLVNLADAVPSHLLRDVSDYKSTDNTFKQREVSQPDIKPDIMVLSEETVKVRLRKLTESTGVPPENLFRCAESTCGGFFSLYELWLSHMKGRHCSLICSCPHCPNTCQDNSDREMLKLTDFEGHFEVHRGHAYICFHCLDTFKYENDLRNHAEIVHQLNEIRLEQIRCNISYAYNVLINSELYTERIMFLSELLKLLGKKLKELEEIHLNKLRHRWLVPNTTDWLENFPSHQCSRELIKKCLQGGCKYLATKDETLYDHIRSQHEIIGHSFLCSQCPFQLANCDSWEPIFEHLKVHSLSHLHICCVCSFHHRCRSSLMGHIRQEHDARDAPFVQITKNGESIFVELAIVFANGELSFSTMRDCFCCEEHSMKADVLALHLKHYHKLRLNYYCELCYIRLDGLQNCDEHFNERHLNKKRKIYCTLAHQGNLTVTSIQPFQIHLQNLAETLLIKSEPKDDSVIVLEEDDIAIAGDISKKANSEANRPTLRCVSTQNLLKSAAVNSSTNRLFPIRIINRNAIQTNEGPLKPFLIEQSPRDIPEDLQRNFGSYT